MVKIFGVLIFFFLLFVIFMAWVIVHKQLKYVKMSSVAKQSLEKWKGGKRLLQWNLERTGTDQDTYCDKLFTDILKGLNPVDKYDMTSEILFLFEVYPEVRKLTKYIVLLELKCQKIAKKKSF